VFEGHGGRWVQIASGFEEWITKRCKDAHRQYSKRHWDAVVAGPHPFTLEEQRIVEARRHFTCRLVGLGADGKLILEVFNGSSLTLPFLSLGTVSKGSNLQSGIWLPIPHVHPGQKSVTQHSVYNPPATPEGFAVYLLPDPEPEDRERYWEFKATSP
jgi:hypothetical protein